MTYGDICFRLTKAFPGIDPDLIEGFIQERYLEVLGELPWTGQQITGVLQTVAPYADGTVTLANASNVVTGGGTAFTLGMTGRTFRVTGRDESYEFTYVGAGAGTLDRAYEGPDGAGLAYQIYQSVYALPAGCRMLQDNAFGGLKRMDCSQINQGDPNRIQSGTPGIWASLMDKDCTPPLMSVELYPAPDTVTSFPFTYVTEANLASTQAVLQVWIQPAALIEGATAKAKAHLKDYTGAQFHSLTAKAALANMRTSEAQGMAPAQMQLDSYFTRHRARRWQR